MMGWYNPDSGLWHFYKPSDLSHRDLRLDRELAALWNWEGHYPFVSVVWFEFDSLTTKEVA